MVKTAGCGRGRDSVHVLPPEPLTCEVFVPPLQQPHLSQHFCHTPLPSLLISPSPCISLTPLPLRLRPQGQGHPTLLSCHLLDKSSWPLYPWVSRLWVLLGGVPSLCGQNQHPLFVVSSLT